MVGGVEVLQVLSSQLHLSGPVWDFINNTLDLGNSGFFIVAILVLSWIISTIVYRVKKYEDIEVTSSMPPAA